VQHLVPKWIFAFPRTLEVTPVVVDGVIYVTSVNEAHAIDARSGRELWHYARARTQGMVGEAASGTNRGVAVLGDRVVMVSDNAHLLRTIAQEDFSKPSTSRSARPPGRFPISAAAF